MALKRRNKVNALFSMASMTDVIFLLLIFFMVTSTIVIPSAIKVNLPQAKQQASAKPMTRVIIDENLNHYVQFGSEKAKACSLEELPMLLRGCQEKEPDMYVALYADESVPYSEVVKVLNIAGENKLKLVLATRPLRDS